MQGDRTPPAAAAEDLTDLRRDIESMISGAASAAAGKAGKRLAVAARLPRDSPVMPSLVEVWPGAEYHERETFEMLGVTFAGHPDLRGILLPEDWADIPPLRKDFRSPGR